MDLLREMKFADCDRVSVFQLATSNLQLQLQLQLQLGLVKVKHLL